KLEMTRAFLRPDMAVLEFGCGTGSTAIAHAPFVKHIQAIDVSSKMIEIAQRKAAENAIENVTFRHAAIDRIDIPDCSLDAVLGLNVLHVLANWQEIPARVHRMLKPGGVFVSSTMCLGDSMKFLKYVVPIGKALGLMPAVKVFTTGELLSALTAAGFKIEKQWQPAKNTPVFIVAKKAG
ncbi:MAG: class I SAM-dependent methyltransferase, partial [Pseudomonadota bacterium]|nr:class I SAM-dependent methyltransferase [Pseudomonadota bacterium]